MLRDQHMDELVDAFEAGFAEASDLSAECPFDQSDKIRYTAWLDGVHYSTPVIAQHLYCRESLVLSAATLACYGNFRPHPF